MICLENLERISKALWHCHEATHTQGLQYVSACDFQEMAAVVDNEAMAINATNETKEHEETTENTYEVYEVGDVINLQTADGQIVFIIMPNLGVHVLKMSPLREGKKTREKAQICCKENYTKDGQPINDYGCFIRLIDQASRGHIHIVKDLLSSNVQYTQDYLDEALHAAVENGHFPVESFLISKGAKYSRQTSKDNKITMFKVYCPACEIHLDAGTPCIVCKGCGEYRTGDYEAHAKAIALERHLTLMQNGI